MFEVAPGCSSHRRAQSRLRVEVHHFGGEVRCIARPEHILAGHAVEASGSALQARVRTVIFGGSWHRVELALQPGDRAITAEGRGEPGVAEGDAVSVTFAPGSIVAFDPGTGQDRIG